MAGRPRTPIGSWGTISLRRSSTGQWRARTRYRDQDGHLRQVTASGTSKSRAQRQLQDKLQQRYRASEGSNLTSKSTLTQLIDYYLERIEIKPQTLYKYQTTTNKHINPTIGNLLLEEITPGRIAALLDSVGNNTAAHMRSILRPAFALAVSYDIMPINPLEHLPKRSNKLAKVRALTTEEIIELRQGIADYYSGRINQDGRIVSKPRQRSCINLPAFMDMLLATGCRPGELLALRWKDIDLDSTPPTVLIAATIVSAAGKAIRQEGTKTGKQRTLILPPYAVHLLMSMKSGTVFDDPDDPVFRSQRNIYFHVGSANNAWKIARRAAGRGDHEKFAWVTFRTMRKTIATLIDRASSDEEAAAQLGHASTSMTHRHYIEARAMVAPDLTEILQGIAPNQVSREKTA